MANEQVSNEQRSKRRPRASKPKTAHDERKFNEIRDLLRLEFSLDGKETLTVYSATPAQMTALAGVYADVSDVDLEVWPVGERLDFVNALWAFCETKNFDFPLRIRDAVTPPVERAEEGSVSNLA